MDRRQLLGLIAVGALTRRLDAGTAQTPGAADPLPRPGVVGAPRRVVDSVQNDPAVVGVERRLRCPCPCGLDVFTCRTTDFTCTYSPARHDEVVALFREGKSPEEVVAAFVDRYGEEALMAPKATGFGVVGYLLPGAAILTGASLLGWYILRRSRLRAARVEMAAASAGSLGLAPDIAGGDDRQSAEEVARLQRALRDLET